MIGQRTRFIGEKLMEAAIDSPERLFGKLYFAGREPESVTVGDLWSRSVRFARHLESSGVRRGQVVVLILDHGIELLSSFVGSVLYGAVPTYFSPPTVRLSADRYRESISQLLAVCNTSFLVTSERFRQIVSDLSMIKAMNIVLVEATDSLAATDDFPWPQPSLDEIAFLQHSSGTTGIKKGVALTHGAVLNQLRHYSRSIELNCDDKIVSWLPLYHDMGLVACFLQSLCSGVPLHLLSPFDWIARPLTLLEVIEKERATLCWQPNFAFALLGARVSRESTKSLDLSSMRAFINCSEPITPKAQKWFLERFLENGITGRKLQTCYAMAENTFAVTQSSILEPVRQEEIDGELFATLGIARLVGVGFSRSKTVVSSGKAIEGCEIRIVDSEGNPLPDRGVGEIAVKSDCVLKEYFNRPDLTQSSLHGSWFYTGDIGYLADGHLFVTGRKKDVIIVAGKNIYPTDIEETVGLVAGVLPGRVVAFGICREEMGTEEVVVLAEVEAHHLSTPGGVKMAIAHTLRSHLDCSPGDIRLLAKGTLAKSTSGKIARPANKEFYLASLRKSAEPSSKIQEQAC